MAPNFEEHNFADRPSTSFRRNNSESESELGQEKVQPTTEESVTNQARTEKAQMEKAQR